MRILVLGGDGMLGHRLVKSLIGRHRVSASFRGESAWDRSIGLGLERGYFRADLRDTNCLAKILDDCRPELIVNAVGIVKHRAAAKDPIASIEINALMPHQLALMAGERAARVIHISTDCVFSGKRGNYTEDDHPDPSDLYGQTKLLGEVADHPNVLTIRTSIIGWELRQKQGLLEWFVSQPGPVAGYANAIFSGLTTIEMSRIIEMVALSHPDLSGLYHISAEPISKLDLLRLIGQQIHLSCKIVPDETFRIDRSLDSTRFRLATGYTPPSWPKMIGELAASIQ